MVNALLIGKDINYLKKLVNNISIDTLRVFAIAQSQIEINTILSKKLIDIIIIYLSEDELNNYIHINDLKAFKKSIIIITNEKKKFFNNINDYVYSYIYEPCNYSYISANISTLICYKFNFKNKIQKKYDYSLVISHIKKELKSIGYNFSYTGTLYLIEVLAILYNFNIYNNYNLKRDIYPIVAQKYNTSVHNVKCNIRNATETMFYNNKETLVNYIGTYYNYNPGSKTIISSVLEKIR